MSEELEKRPSDKQAGLAFVPRYYLMISCAVEVNASKLWKRECEQFAAELLSRQRLSQKMCFNGIACNPGNCIDR